MLVSDGNGNEARIVDKRLCLSSLHCLDVTLTDNRNGPLNLHLDP
jgi:hypothetical protein